MILEDVSRDACIALSINGYGAPHVPEDDANLHRYLGRIFSAFDLLNLGTRIEKIYLCGGKTNRSDMSEAEALRLWIDRHEPQFVSRLELIDTTFSAQENVAVLSERVRGMGLRPVLACEHSRRFTMRLLAQHFLGSSAVVLPIRFDEGSLRPKNQFKQVLVHLPIEALSLKSGLVDAWRRHKRIGIMERAHRAYEASARERDV